MRSRFFVTALIFLLSLTVTSCGGGGGGASGSSDGGDTDIVIQSVLLSVESDDIDVFQNPTACDGEPESPLTDANGTIIITASALNQNPDFSPFPANVESCKVEYKSAVIGAPPIESRTIFPNCSFTEGSTECNVEIINIARKDQWWNHFDTQKFIPAEYPTKYTVVYECSYQNAFREHGKLGGRIDIDLADWLVCGG